MGTALLGENAPVPSSPSELSPQQYASPAAVSEQVWANPPSRAGKASVTTTVTLAVPSMPSEVAVMVVLPTLRPATSPFASTVATEGAELVQVTARPIRVS